ncbi:MAG: SUMF1/EgtB/PvdO family nonheme iron enzyme, partial [Gammaproteobacteria bacterium]
MKDFTSRNQSTGSQSSQNNLVCRRCHTPLPASARFCLTCGTRVRREDSRKFDSDITEVLSNSQKAELQQRMDVIKTKYGVAAKKREIPDILLRENHWVKLKGDGFLMGSPPMEYGRCEDEELHHVKVGSFELMSTPVTFAMYDLYCDKTGREKPPHGGWGRENHPVINVSFWDAVDYVDWVNAETGWRCRLPTEA